MDFQTDGSVLGSLHLAANDLRYSFLPRVAHILDLDPLVVSIELNQRPCRVGKACIWPTEAMRNLVEEVIQRVDGY